MTKKLLLITLFLVSFGWVSGQILQGSTTVNAANNMTITVTVNTNTNVVDITMTGNSSAYYGYGFGGSSMSGTYAIITEGSGNIMERVMGNHSAGTLLSGSLTTSSHSTSGSIATTTVSRPRVGLTGSYYTFPNTPGSFSIIWSKGLSSTLGSHQTRGSSIVTLSDICNIPINDLGDETVCLGDSAMIFGTYRTTAGVYYDTLTTSVGCDSVLSKELVVTPLITNSLGAITFCEGDSVFVFGNFENATGFYYDTLSTSLGCDSVIEQELIEKIINPQVFQSTSNFGEVYTTYVGDNYQWIYCPNDSVILGATDSAYMSPGLSDIGPYKVVVTDMGCTDTSNCIAADVWSVEEFSSGLISIYPNPAKDKITVEFTQTQSSGIFELINLSGQSVQNYSFEGGLAAELSLTSLKSGIYLLKFTSKDTQLLQRIQIQ